MREDGALSAPARAIAALPEPFQVAYLAAREADAVGDAETVTEIAAALHTQQTLFDPEPYAVRTLSTTGGQRVRGKTPTTPMTASSGARQRVPRETPLVLLDLAVELAE